MEPTFLEQLGLVLSGAVSGACVTAFFAWLLQRRAEKRDREARQEEFGRAIGREREARHEEYMRRRRDGFENIMAELIPTYDRWKLYVKAEALLQFGRAGEMTPEPEPQWVEDLQDQVDRYLAQLKVRSPSEALDGVLSRAAEARDAVNSSLILNNHVLLSGNEEQQTEAFEEFMGKMDIFDDAVSMLSVASSEDGRRRGSPAVSSDTTQGR